MNNYIIILDPGSAQPEVLCDSRGFAETFSTEQDAIDYATECDLDNYAVFQQATI